MTFVPRLFVRSPTLTRRAFVERLYGDAFKHAWSVRLNDAEFAARYNALTQHEHVSVNYDRGRLKPNTAFDRSEGDFIAGFRDFVQARHARATTLSEFARAQHYDSEAESIALADAGFDIELAGQSVDRDSLFVRTVDVADDATSPRV